MPHTCAACAQRLCTQQEPEGVAQCALMEGASGVGWRGHGARRRRGGRGRGGPGAAHGSGSVRGLLGADAAKAALPGACGELLRGRRARTGRHGLRRLCACAGRGCARGGTRQEPSERQVGPRQVLFHAITQGHAWRMEPHTASLLKGMCGYKKGQTGSMHRLHLHRPACLCSFSWCNVGMLAYLAHAARCRGPLCICWPHQGQDICPRLCCELHCMCLQLYSFLHKACI